MTSEGLFSKHEDALEAADAHDLGLAVALCRLSTCVVL